MTNYFIFNRQILQLRPHLWDGAVTGGDKQNIAALYQVLYFRKPGCVCKICRFLCGDGGSAVIARHRAVMLAKIPTQGKPNFPRTDQSYFHTDHPVSERYPAVLFQPKPDICH